MFALLMCALHTPSNVLLALQIGHFLFNMPVVYQPHPLFLHADETAYAQAQCWKGSSGHKQLCRRMLYYYATVATEHAGYVLYRALVLSCAQLASFPGLSRGGGEGPGTHCTRMNRETPEKCGVIKILSYTLRLSSIELYIMQNP